MINKQIENDENLQTASEVMTDVTEQETEDSSQKKSYEGYLEMDESKSDELAKIEQTASVNDEFEGLGDAELEKLYDEALDISDGERTEYQEALLEQTKERYLKIKFYRQFEDAAKWFETEYDDKKFEDVVTDNAFLEFAAGVKLPIRELVRRFLEMNEKNEVSARAKGPGSVQNYGATVGKDYFSRAEVEKMSEEDITKNLETIKKSMRKWK